ncbi:MAG: energy-coupling factor transporter transmembrane protein EcfT [Calditerrivibrio sp.]|nr:energy-coupling factor transporter transmembrane protein EcfT [Calditerrivibrio sp.]
MNTQIALEYVLSFEELNHKNSYLNKLSPLTKILILAIFLLTNVSINKYDLTKILFMSAFVLYLFILSPLPLSLMIKFSLTTSLFIVPLIIFNPFLDNNVIKLNNVFINAGLVSAITTYIKFLNIIICTLTIISSTNFKDLVHILSKFKVPKELLMTLLLMYRFLFIFLHDLLQVQETISSKRTCYKKITLKDMKYIISTMFIRAINRAEAICESINAKGGISSFHFKKDFDINKHDYIFIFSTIIYIFLVKATL